MKEGTTQGDPLAVVMYGVATLPLIKKVAHPKTFQKWYTDVGNVIGDLPTLRRLRDDLKVYGLGFGSTSTKCHLIVRNNIVEKAQETFADKDRHLLDGHSARFDQR